MDLEEKLYELAKKSFLTISPLSLLDKKDSIKKRMKRLKPLCDIYLELEGLTKIKELERFKPEDLNPNDEDYHAKLGFFVKTHDIHAQGANIINKLNKKNYNNEEIFIKAANVRQGIVVAGYVAKGDKSLLFDVESRYVVPLLEQRCEGIGINLDSKLKELGFDEIEILRQFVSNSAVNYIANKIDESINISVEENSKYRILTISDKGTGIKTDDLSEIFTTYTEDGTGIGLQLVKRLTELRNGHIEVYTRHNGITKSYSTNDIVDDSVQLQSTGTTFKIYLPKT